MALIDAAALEIASRLRTNECPHGVPYRVFSATLISPWGSDASCRPLCDACIMQAVRDVLRELVLGKE